MAIWSGGCKTLIVEKDDEKAERLDRTLANFPDQENHRAKTALEALAILRADDSFEQVIVAGSAYTVKQAIPLLEYFSKQ